MPLLMLCITPVFFQIFFLSNVFLLCNIFFILSTLYSHIISMVSAWFEYFKHDSIDGLAQVCIISIASTVEILQSCTKPSQCSLEPDVGGA